jgi:type IV pilus assembly protein PilO
MEQFLERIAKAPVGAKLAGVAVVIGLVTVLNYLVIGVSLGPSISEIEDRIIRVNSDQHKLDGELIEKQAIANDLNRFRKERELLEQRLKQALAELPEQKNLDELLQMFQDQAQKSGLEIVSIVPDAPASAGFYVKIPIKMRVSGNFHEIATFFDALGRLRRIVNVGTITLDSPKDVSGKVTVAGSFVATTFMFAPAPPPSAPAAPGKPAKGKT